MGRRSRFFANTLVMTAGALAIRFINLAFRAWLFTTIGARGVGEYQLMMTVFFLGVTLCTSGFGFAVTRTIAESRGGRDTIRICTLSAVVLSIVAAGAMWIAAPLLGNTLLGGEETVLPLRLLSLGLPLIAVTSCLRGCFIARRSSILPAITDLVELLAAIAFTVELCNYTSPLVALCLGATLGDLFACAVISVGYLLHFGGERMPRHGSASIGVLLHVAAPVWVGSLLRSALGGAENLLIPLGLTQHGGESGAALAQYGAVGGMVFPVILLPLCILTSAAMLLVPELAEMNARGHRRSIETAATKSIELTLWFSFIAAAVILFFAEELGLRFFDSGEAGRYLRIMAPIIPLLYLDSVVDGMLKGLDQQAYSFRYNIIDGILRVAMAAVLLPWLGITGYFLLLYLSELFNCALSLGRLVKVAELRVDVVWWLVAPAMAAVTLYLMLSFATRALSGL